MADIESIINGEKRVAEELAYHTDTVLERELKRRAYLRQVAPVPSATPDFTDVMEAIEQRMKRFIQTLKIDSSFSREIGELAIERVYGSAYSRWVADLKESATLLRVDKEAGQ